MSKRKKRKKKRGKEMPHNYYLPCSSSSVFSPATWVLRRIAYCRRWPALCLGVSCRCLSCISLESFPVSPYNTDLQCNPVTEAALSLPGSCVSSFSLADWIPHTRCGLENTCEVHVTSHEHIQKVLSGVATLIIHGSKPFMFTVEYNIRDYKKGIF